jgi:hypothetical protein
MIATYRPPAQIIPILYLTVKTSSGGATLRAHQAAEFLIRCLPTLTESW